ncbi:MAG: hypothetical protein ABI407_11040 [Bradyrhizobium sp.]
MPVGLPTLFDNCGARVLIEQISRASRRLRAHLREGRGGELIVNVSCDDFLELNHTVVDAARGLIAGGLKRADRTIPNQDVAPADDKIVCLDIRRHFQNARIADRLLRIEAENATVDLIEHEQVALCIGRERLWTCQFHVFTGGRDADRRGGGTHGELPHHSILSCSDPRKPGGPSHHDGPKQPVLTKHVRLNIQQIN